MARKMDSHKENIQKLQKLNEEYKLASKQVREIDKKRKQLSEELLKTMQNSHEATLDGKIVFEVKETARRSTRIDLVLQYAPELADKLIESKISRSIKFV